nr:zinc ribbon domain-containing protein [Eubacterium sp.]
MALIHCPECGNQISDKAHSCPECGFPLLEYLNNNTPDVSNIEKSIDGYHENQEEKKTDLLYEDLSDSYYETVKIFNNANTLDEYKEALRNFSKLGEYRDTVYYVNECKKKIKSINYEVKIEFFFETLKNSKDKSEIGNI